MKPNLNLHPLAVHYLIVKQESKQIEDYFLYQLIIFKNNLMLLKNSKLLYRIFMKNVLGKM